MSQAELVIAFLTSLAHALSTMALYSDEHPAARRAVEAVYERLFRLQEADPRPAITFLGDEVVYERRPLPGLKTWEWGPRLATAGIQRLEFDGPASLEDLEAFLEDVMGRIGDRPAASSEARQTRATPIRYGSVGLKGEGRSLASEGRLTNADVNYTLQEEAETIRWVHQELAERGTLQMMEAEAVVRSLTVAMHGDQEFMIPLLKLKAFDQYTTTHALNVSTLSMALSEFMGLGDREVRRFGIAGLLHDLGKVRIPPDILNKPGKLSESEREVMNRHPVEGAKLLIEREASLDLAAVVAYEHHIRIDGGGYPNRTYPRPCHPASDLVHVCDVYDALRTHRPYREAWSQERVLDYLEEGTSSEFDPGPARAFVQMMRRWAGRVVELDSETAGLPLGSLPSASGPSPSE